MVNDSFMTPSIGLFRTAGWEHQSKIYGCSSNPSCRREHNIKHAAKIGGKEMEGKGGEGNDVKRRRFLFPLNH